jgi:hypothetical protein
MKAELKLQNDERKHNQRITKTCSAPGKNNQRTRDCGNAKPEKILSGKGFHLANSNKLLQLCNH